MKKKIIRKLPNSSKYKNCKFCSKTGAFDQNTNTWVCEEHYRPEVVEQNYYIKGWVVVKCRCGHEYKNEPTVKWYCECGYSFTVKWTPLVVEVENEPK